MLGWFQWVFGASVCRGVVESRVRIRILLVFVREAFVVVVDGRVLWDYV